MVIESTKQADSGREGLCMVSCSPGLVFQVEVETRIAVQVQTSLSLRRHFAAQVQTSTLSQFQVFTAISRCLSLSSEFSSQAPLLNRALKVDMLMNSVSRRQC